MNQQTYHKLPRELRYLSAMGLNSYELEYFIQVKRKKDIARKWKH